MKGRYMSILVLLACRSKPTKDIHTALQETMAEHKIIMKQWAATFTGQSTTSDIHARLKETLAERRKLIQQWEQAVSPKWDTIILLNSQQAA